MRQAAGAIPGKVFSGQKTALDRLCSPMERLLYRVAAVNPAVEMGAREYTTCFVFFSLAGTLL
ncbi:MAG: potassium-transporting ATPase subunit KdpA, partial [Terriglobales bacterium]